MYLGIKINLKTTNIPLEFHLASLVFGRVLKSITGNSPLCL